MKSIVWKSFSRRFFLGVPLATAFPAARVATFAAIFLLPQKGFPLPSLTQGSVWSQSVPELMVSVYLKEHQ